ncbi:MAG: hypothetical protein GX554_01750 [Elusimicrobia bacterium]|jgi:hypothetical protein|nr:hypothetical protein [Elusimicrobiota bacterium]
MIGQCAMPQFALPFLVGVVVFLLSFLFRSYFVPKDSVGRIDKIQMYIRGLQYFSWLMLILAVLTVISGGKDEGWLYLSIGIIGFLIWEILQSFEERLAKLESSGKKDIEETK